MTNNVVEIPEKLKVLVGPIQGLVDLIAQQVERGEHGARVAYGQFSQRLEAAAAELERSGHACGLGALDIDADAITVDGELYRKAGRNPGTYYAKAGSVTVPRSI